VLLASVCCKIPSSAAGPTVYEPDVAPLPPPRPGDARGLRQYTRQIMQAISELAGELAQGGPETGSDGSASAMADGVPAERAAEGNSITEQDVTVRE